MSRFAFTPLLCLCLAAASPAPVAAVSIDEAEVDLGSDVFKVREEAERAIRMAGIGQYDRVAKLTTSSDPEVAARARRSLPILLLDIDARFPQDLAAKLRRLDEFHGQDLEQIVAALASLDPARPVTLIGLHSHWLASPPEFLEATAKLLEALEQSLRNALRLDQALGELERIQPERYEAASLAMVLNHLCKHQPEDLTPVLPLYERWTNQRPRLLQHLNGDGYRLEVEREARKAPNRAESLRKILLLAATSEMSSEQLAAVRRQLGTYREDATSFPVHTLDLGPAWFFFDVFGSDQGGTVHLDAYREFRRRFPDIPESNLLGQPLEVLQVLEKSGPAAAFDYALKLRVHGGAMLLGEWLHARPGLIREPLPLPAIKEGEEYPYRPVKFFRIFAPYAEESEMMKHQDIMAAYEILAKDPGWRQVARQARAALAEQNTDAAKRRQ